MLSRTPSETEAISDDAPAPNADAAHTVNELHPMPDQSLSNDYETGHWEDWPGDEEKETVEETDEEKETVEETDEEIYFDDVPEVSQFMYPGYYRLHLNCINIQKLFHEFYLNL